MNTPPGVVKLDAEALPRQLRMIALRNADSDARYLEYAADLIEYLRGELRQIADAAAVAASPKQVTR